MNIYVFLAKLIKYQYIKSLVKFGMKIIFSQFLVLIFYGCLFLAMDPVRKGIDVYNNTDYTLYVSYSISDSLGNGYPIVLFEEVNIDNKVSKRSPCYRLNPYSNGSIGIPGRITLLQSCDDNMLRLFFITESTMREYSWEEICENQMYEKRLTLTKKDLEKTDWVVIYE